MKLINLKFEEIKREFEIIKNEKEIHSILLYGSYAKKQQHKKSDIDICIVTPGLTTPKEFSNLLGKIWRKVDGMRYDIRLFEELPLYIKASIIKNYKIIFSKNLEELYYYFYKVRKIWDDQSINWIDKKI